MDEEKLCRAVDWLRSVLTRENLAPIEKFELSDIGQHHYRLSFEMNGVEKVFPMAAIYVEGIADGYERIQAQIKPLLLDLAKVADRYIRGRLSSAGLALLRRGRWITTPTPPGIAMPDRLDTRFGTLHLTMLSSVIPNRVLVRFEGVVNDRANAGVFADRRHSTA